MSGSCSDDFDCLVNPVYWVGFSLFLRIFFLLVKDKKKSLEVYGGTVQMFHFRKFANLLFIYFFFGGGQGRTYKTIDLKCPKINQSICRLLTLEEDRQPDIFKRKHIYLRKYRQNSFQYQNTFHPAQ